MYQISIGQMKAELPEFGPGEAVLRMYEAGDALLIHGIHGSKDGLLSFRVSVDETSEREEYSFSVDTDPSELYELARDLAGWEGPILIAPCYPAAVRCRYGDDPSLCIIGDWNTPIMSGWTEQDDALVVWQI